ncbi:MAG: murein biosynthesis integral membrane protein MurJ [Alphaproteobacteria bacterium]|nr:murein biosynthesis integral membrane protein MurJ [Alphaproteobacteria bacterium]
MESIFFFFCINRLCLLLMKLFRSFAVVGGFTIISRLFGFFRDVLIAGILGVGVVADVFFVALRLPNLFRRLFAEGAFTSVFVPLFSERLECDGQESARRFAQDVLSGLLFILVIFTVCIEIFMPWVLYLFAPGFVQEAAKYDLLISFSRLTFPYLLCMSVMTLFAGILNAFGRFAASSAAPILLNLVLIFILIMLSFFWDGEVVFSGFVLCLGIMLAGAMQLFVLWRASRHTGLILKLGRPVWSPDVRRLVFKGIPSVISGGITQINLIFGTAIASLQESGISYLYYAERIYQLPLGVIGIALGVVLLPDLSRRFKMGQLAHVHDIQNRSLEISLLLTLPLSVAFFMLADPIIRVLFQRGAFEASSVFPISWALMAFSVGLPSFVLLKVLLPFFFARGDTHIPMWFSLINLLVNVLASILLYFPFGHVGIAIATSLSSWVNVVLLWSVLVYRGHFDLDEDLRVHSRGIFLASVILGLCLWPLGSFFSPLFESGTELIRVVLLFVLCGLSMLIFFLAASLLGKVNFLKMWGRLTGNL